MGQVPGPSFIPWSGACNLRDLLDQFQSAPPCGLHKNEAAVAGGFTRTSTSHMEMLLQLGRNTLEFAVEVGANRVDGGDNYDRNASGNQPVFDCSCTRLIFEKRRNSRHVTAPCNCSYGRNVAVRD
jgi:hypothetical protein